MTLTSHSFDGGRPFTCHKKLIIFILEGFIWKKNVNLRVFHLAGLTWVGRVNSINLIDQGSVYLVVAIRAMVIPNDLNGQIYVPVL